MMKANIHQLYSIKQDAKEGIYTMKGIAFTNLLHTLIREYGTYHDGSYSIDPKTFSFPDIRLILSYVLDSGEYEWACTNNERLKAIYIEHINTIQTLLDSECYAVYCEDMEDMGIQRNIHRDNGEVYWVSR